MAILFDLEDKKIYDVYAKIIIGTDETCDIIPKGNEEILKTVSGRHAEIFIENENYCLEDLDSENRTKLIRYGKDFSMTEELDSYRPVELHSGNDIMLGSYKMKFIEH